MKNRGRPGQVARRPQNLTRVITIVRQWSPVRQRPGGVASYGRPRSAPTPPGKEIAVMFTEHFLRHRRGVRIEAGERRRLESAVSEVRTHAPRTTLVRAGDNLNTSTLLLDGILSRHIDDRKGLRQLVAVHVPGDFVDLHAFPLRTLDHDVATVTAASVAIVPHARARGDHRGAAQPGAQAVVRDPDRRRHPSRLAVSAGAAGCGRACRPFHLRDQRTAEAGRPQRRGPLRAGPHSSRPGGDLRAHQCPRQPRHAPSARGATVRVPFLRRRDSGARAPGGAWDSSIRHTSIWTTPASARPTAAPALLTTV